MTKKLFDTMAVVAAVFAGYSMQCEKINSDVSFLNIEALAQNENNYCLNGCIDNGDGCYCYRWYPDYREAGTRQ